VEGGKMLGILGDIQTEVRAETTRMLGLFVHVRIENAFLNYVEILSKLSFCVGPTGG
jgi:hypothetical protein